MNSGDVNYGDDGVSFTNVLYSTRMGVNYGDDCASFVNHVLHGRPLVDEPDDVCRCQAAIVFGHEPKCPVRPESHMTQPVPVSPWIGHWVIPAPPAVEQDDGL